MIKQRIRLEIKPFLKCAQRLYKDGKTANLSKGLPGGLLYYIDSDAVAL